MQVPEVVHAVGEVFYSLTKWTSPQVDNAGWGETQEVQWDDYVDKLFKAL
jgi:hypothetical protein